jgi:transcription elongation GreA/GreB family factor
VVEAFLGSESRLVACLQRLPTREGAAFLECAAHRAGGRLHRALAADLERLPVKAIGEVLPFLVREGAAEDCLARIRAALLSQQGSSPTLVCWMAANPAAVREYRLGDLTAVFLLALGVLDRSEMGDQMRAQKQLRERFLDTAWLQSVFEATDEIRRLDLVRRLDACTGWDATAKRSVLARVVKLYPDLVRGLSVGRPAEERAAPARFTSWRSLRERQAQLRKIKEEDIPANSREIAVARSYGDLRENFEYQSARDLQRMLLKREAELQADLGAMQGTDFSGASCEQVGMGVEVELARPSGSHRVIRILGEWDRDEERAVVSSHSLVAERLGGLAVGDTAVLPMDGSEETCRIEAVRPLPDDVRQWAATGP